MKPTARKSVIAVTAVALLAGGTATAFAISGSDEAPAADQRTNSSLQTAGDDGDDDRQALQAKTSAEQAIAAALKVRPGQVESAELDDEDDSSSVWEIDIYGKDKRWYDVHIDARSGKVVTNRQDREDNDDDRDELSELKSAKITAAQASAAALKEIAGTLESIELDDEDDRPGWEAEVITKDGISHTVTISAMNSQVIKTEADSDD